MHFMATVTASLATTFAAIMTVSCSGPAPVLGKSVNNFTTGYGVAAPTLIDNGRHASAIVENIRWENWGEDPARGTGTALYVGRDESFAEGRREPAQIVAYKIGDCSGKKAYLLIDWYFPQHGETFTESAGIPTCEEDP